MPKKEVFKILMIFILITIVFFSTSLVITYDSAHFLEYISIFEGDISFSRWDIVRGPVFPIIMYINNIFFGKSSLGMLTGMFLYYIIYCLIVYIFVNVITKDLKYRKIVMYLLCSYCFINPIVLGYYHTLLTEYVAITLTMSSLYMSWKWYKIKTKKEQVLYSLYFIIGLTFAYFLKQPYICIILIPMIISIIYSLIINKKNPKKIYYFTTLLTSIIVMIFSIFLWNKLLEYKEVNVKTGRDSSGMLSKQLLNAIDGYKVNVIENYEEIKSDKYLTKKEKKNIKKVLDSKSKVLIITIHNGKKTLEKDFLTVKSGDQASATDTLLEIANTFFKYPKIVIRSYSKNYCGLSSLCVITSENDIMYSVSNHIDLLHMYENERIAYKTFRKEQKYFEYPEETEEIVSYYISPINQGIIARLITYTFKITSVLFKFSIFLSGLFIIILIVFRIRIKKRIKDKELYLLSLMLLSTAFLTTVANSLSGAMIDRYSAICFIPSLLGFVGMVIFISKNINRKESKK